MTTARFAATGVGLLDAMLSDPPPLRLPRPHPQEYVTR